MIEKMKQGAVWTALLLGAAMSQASAQTRPAQIKIENLTSFNTPSIQEAVAEDAPAFAARLASGKYALWTYVDGLGLKNGKNYCIAFVGLTQPGSAGRNARIPSNRTLNVHRPDKRGTFSADDWNSCKSTALRGAITSFAREDWKTIAREADADTTEAGSRKRLPADPDKYRVSYLGFYGSTKDIDAPAEFASAFDYREVQLVVLAGALALDDEAVCYASAGVAARAPDNRKPRFPGYKYSMLTVGLVQNQRGRDEAEKLASCEAEAARGAVASVFEDSWDQKGFLDGIEKTREDGVSLVRQARAAKVAKAAPARTTRSAGTQVNPQSCTNHCVNGDCVREFDDGRKERFQAQRVYNPFKNDWEWKVDGCGG